MPPDFRRRFGAFCKAYDRPSRRASPEAEEIISYGKPAFRQGTILVWFGAHTNHIGLYPKVAAMTAFKRELSAYKHTKGSVRFPLDEPVPLDLIAHRTLSRPRGGLESDPFKRY